MSTSADDPGHGEQAPKPRRRKPKRRGLQIVVGTGVTFAVLGGVLTFTLGHHRSGKGDEKGGCLFEVTNVVIAPSAPVAVGDHSTNVAGAPAPVLQPDVPKVTNTPWIPDRVALAPRPRRLVPDYRKREPAPEPARVAARAKPQLARVAAVTKPPAAAPLPETPASQPVAQPLPQPAARSEVANTMTTAPGPASVTVASRNGSVDVTVNGQKVAMNDAGGMRQTIPTARYGVSVRTVQYPQEQVRLVTDQARQLSKLAQEGRWEEFSRLMEQVTEQGQ